MTSESHPGTGGTNVGGDGQRKEIRPTKAFTELPRARTGTTGVVTSRPYVNDGRNGRCDRSFPAKRVWKIAWKKEVQRELKPLHLICDKRFTAIQGIDMWEAFSVMGERLAVWELGESDITYDAEKGSVYYMDRNGLLNATSLETKQLKFAISIHLSDSYHRTFALRSGDMLYLAGVQLAKNPHDSPKYSILEMHDLKKTEHRNDMGMPDEETLTAERKFSSAAQFIAYQRDNFVVALPDSIMIVDKRIQTRTVLTGSFVPKSMSVDESSRIYMIVEKDAGSALWIVDPDGTRMLEYPLPADFGEPAAPPIVGYDHSVYLLSSSHILALQGNGAFAWQRKSAGNFIGGIISSDNLLLVSESSRIAAYDKKGEVEGIFEFGQEKLSTPPVMRDDGSILVAGEKFLFCLEGKEK